ncbi:hypothetical protein [Paenirhodobacter populi]|uniref:Uncharacterized protein n=1 Tax=Paenirhodobacter populi TaxID=2306993 RepID=A0A443JLX4_9RHOB|nr:hypothetical protein [Sinirhodobacter populi]RWR21502.1 hypothetical protein D2T30_09220 [Sinirhodobacter populi]
MHLIDAAGGRDGALRLWAAHPEPAPPSAAIRMAAEMQFPFAHSFRQSDGARRAGPFRHPAPSPDGASISRFIA